MAQAGRGGTGEKENKEKWEEIERREGRKENPLRETSKRHGVDEETGRRVEGGKKGHGEHEKHATTRLCLVCGHESRNSRQRLKKVHLRHKRRGEYALLKPPWFSTGQRRQRGGRLVSPLKSHRRRRGGDWGGE